MSRMIAILLLALFSISCQSAVKTGQSTALSGIDLVAMTDDMSSRIASDQQVIDAIARKGSLKIVVQPVVNNLRAEVIPTGQATAFTGRVRVLLSKYAPDRFTWIMNRDAFYSLRSRELELSIDPGPSPDAINPEYALTATFSSLGEETRKKREQYYLCVFELTNLMDRTILWSGSYEVKKTAVKGFLD